MKTFSSFTFLFLLNTLSLQASAGEILKVKEQRVLLLFSDDEIPRIRQKFNINHPDTGIKTGTIEITKKRNNKAIGKILNGYAREGGLTKPYGSSNDLNFEANSADKAETLSSASEKGKDETRTSESETDELLDEVLESRPKKKKDSRTLSSVDDGEVQSPFYDPPEQPFQSKPGHWGFGIGITPTLIKINNEYGTKTLKGNNFVVRIAYDKPLKQAFSVLSGVSLLPLAGTQADDLLGTAKVDASYLSFELNGRVSLYGTPMHGPWVGGGLNYLRSNSISTNVTSSSNFNSHMLFQVSLGLNALMGYEYLCFRWDYLLHPATNSGGNSLSINQSIFSAIYFY